MDGAHMLCMADAPEAREDALALWAWLRTQWAIGLTEAWAKAGKAEVSATSCAPESFPIYAMGYGKQARCAEFVALYTIARNDGSAFDDVAPLQCTIVT